MFKKSHILSLCIILFLVVSSISILGAGGGGGGGSSSSVGPSVPETPPEPEPKEVKIEKTCEELESRFERINCRLKQGPELRTIEESCRVFSDPKDCQNNYRKVIPCYEIKGPEKNKCFRKIAGFSNENLKNQNKEAVRNYVVYLLYDIQEKIEEAHEERKITSEEASVAIDLIIKIKQDIFIKKTKQEIKPEIEDLKIRLKGLKLQ